MAKFSEIMTVVAECIGWPEGAVRQYGRHAREGGFISQGARGNAAPEATPSDATNLLISILAGDYAKDAAKIIPVYRELSPSSIKGIEMINTHLEFKSNTFGDLIDGVIVMAIGGKLEAYVKGFRTEVLGGLRSGMDVPSVSIDLQSYPYKMARVAIAGVSITFIDSPTRKPPRDHQYSDMMVSRSITERTLLTLGDIMRR